MSRIPWPDWPSAPPQLQQAVLDAVSVTPPGGDRELHHYTCCDDKIAICGADVSGEAECGGKCRNIRCALCDLAIDEGLPCTIPGCSPGGD